MIRCVVITNAINVYVDS